MPQLRAMQVLAFLVAPGSDSGDENVQVDVRRASLGDESAIARVHVRTWQVAYRGQIPDAVLDGLSVDRRTASWSQIIAGSSHPASCAFVLEEDGEVCGFAHFAPSRDDDADENVGELTAIYVAPEYWGSGGGTLLLERAIAALRDAGFATATLWVLGSNIRARRFYESASWMPDGLVKTDKRDGYKLDELRYRRDLR